MALRGPKMAEMVWKGAYPEPIFLTPKKLWTQILFRLNFIGQVLFGHKFFWNKKN